LSTSHLMAHLKATPIVPVWLLIILLAAGLVTAFIQYHIVRRRLGLRKALILSLLRLGTFWLLILFAFNISLTSKKEHKTSPAIAILLDTSQSMGLPGKDAGQSRLDQARQILLGGPKPLLPALAETHEVRLYALSESLRELDAKELPALKPGEKGGTINDALKQLAGKVSLVIVLSDGTAGLNGSPHGTDTSPPKGLPVLAIPVGDTGTYRDIVISAVKAPQVAFRGRELIIDATITGRGYTNVTIPVLLKDGGKLVTAKSLHFNKGSENEAVSFPFTPQEIGTHLMSVSTPPQVGESLTSNNSVNLSMKVVRDKTRILFVSGNPSPNYRFMRMALKNDPSVDLLSFVILRTPSNVINVPLQEQSLIPFPVDTLFSGELKAFDLVILDNLPLHVYLNEKHLEAIREFVRSGGGFALIGGPNMADGGRIVSAPMGEVLPVGLTREESYSRGSPSGVRLTSAGAVHPVTRLLPDKLLNLRLWNEMPSLDGLNQLKVKGSGTALLESAVSPAHPVLTVGSYGKGRVLALATDFSWKWDAGMVARGGDNWAYLRFIERAVRWLTKDPGLDPITMLLPDRSQEGQNAEIKVSVREDQSGPARTGEPILFSVFGPQGVKLPSQIKPSGAPGEYIGLFHPEKKGTYRVRVETRTGSLEESLVIAGQMEAFDAAPDHGLLRSISAATGGRVLSASADISKEIAPFMDKARKTFVEEREVPLWSLPYALALVVAFLAVEWYLRRRWGLA
jgi:uncharacterized membrane protein